jgi:hypothetical protein
MKKIVLLIAVVSLIAGYSVGYNTATNRYTLNVNKALKSGGISMATQPKPAKPAFDATTDEGALAWAQKSGGVPFSVKYLKKIGYYKTTK